MYQTYSQTGLHVYLQVDDDRPEDHRNCVHKTENKESSMEDEILRLRAVSNERFFLNILVLRVNPHQILPLSPNCCGKMKKLTYLGVRYAFIR